MRIGRVRAARVGPLRSRELSLEPGLNLVYGGNEAGKTALLDFLVSLLFRREGRRGARLSTVMRGVDRFSETREGEVELIRDGEVLVYPEAPSLLEDLGLGYPGLSGLFCVRSGEMEWPEKEEGEFWAALKKVLSGLPEGVETLRREAHDVAGLTGTGRRMDREDRPLLSRYREARRRAEKLRDLRERLPEAREREEAIFRLERQLERLDRARRARIAELRGRREETREELAGLPDVPGEELERWRTLSVRAASHEERIEELEEELRQAREAHREKAEEASPAEAEARAAAGRRDRLEGDGTGEAGLGERAREHLRAGPADGAGEPAPRRDGVLAGIAIVLALALGAAVLTGFVPGWAGSLGALAGAALAAWLGVRRRRALRRTEARRERAARLLREAEELGLEAGSVEEIPGAVERAMRDVDRAERRSEVKELEATHAGERVEELGEALESARSELRSMRQRMEELASHLDADSLSEAEETGRRRTDLEGRIRTLESALTELAGADPAGWDVEAPADADGLPEWDGERRARLEGELEETRQEYRALRDEFVEAGLTTPEDALIELEECLREMEDMERGWAAGRLAGEIFARMDESLERRLSGVLEADGPFSAAAVTERITGRYVSLSRTGDGGLSVRDGRGRRFAVAELSRGTRDQIYLALRIGLGQAALESAGVGDGGFFLLDDAFLTADWTRRERLVETAADLAEAGWQLIYLTCDDHLRELFVEAGAALHELSP